MLLKRVGLVFILLSVILWSGGTVFASEPHKILILAERHVREGKLLLLQKLIKKNPSLSLTYIYEKDIKEGTSLFDLTTPYDLVIFDAVSGRQAAEIFSRFESVIKGGNKFISIKNNKANKLTHGLDDIQIKNLHAYYRNGGKENLKRLAAYLEGNILGKTEANILPPIVFPKAGIYHPDYSNLIFSDLKAYLKWKGYKKGKTLIALTMSREAIAAADTAIEDHFIKQIEKRGGTAVPYYFQGFMAGQMSKILSVDGKIAVDNIINMSPIHMAEARRTDYEEIGVPILQTIPYGAGKQADWESDPAGIAPMLTPFYLTLSEIAGATDPIVVSAYGKDKKRVPITYQASMVVEKAFQLASLKHKENKDKKLAIMFYNYPSGEKNAGASFLNIPSSLKSISEVLKKQGYRVLTQEEDWYIDQVGQMLRPFFRDLPYGDIKGLGKKEGAGGLLSVVKYRTWYDKLPVKLRRSIEAEWGVPEEAFSIVTLKGQKYFAVPRVLSGNLMILPQPPRGNKKDREASIYHDKKVPISHNYLAVYFYVREVFGADALVHLGTHGSQEYLPGKERGLSRYDAGNLALGDMPVIYPFIMDDVGEALQTKRRGRAVVISHLTPPLVRSGLYQEITDLHNLMHEYKELGKGGVKTKTKEQIISLVAERNIHQDMGWTAEKISENFKEFMPLLHEYIGELGMEIQPLGLHSFGTVPKEDHLSSTIVQMLGKKFSKSALKDSKKYLDKIQGEKQNQKYETGSNAELVYVAFDQLKNSAEFRMVDKFVRNNAKIDVVKDKILKEFLLKGREYYAGFKGTLENRSLLNALKGEYIPSSSGGDPVRSPKALPSGQNLYGFDPSKLPTKAAWLSGKKLTADLIQNFYNKNGRFPDKIAFSLWSIEAMRHLGVIESQVMYAMGVRPMWDENGYVKGTEIIPYSDLKRPRIDVVISATGLYRDALPNVMLLLSKAVDQIAALKEDNNYIFENTKKLKKELLSKGFKKEDADSLSTIRIFSNQSGDYGTGLGGAALASDTWEKDDKLAKLYISRMGYAYGSNPKLWGKRYDKINLYAQNLTGTDAVIFSRSSNVYGLLTSDDPFQYMGGISLAVRSLDGKSPEMFISNLRDPDNVKSETLGKFLSKELRTRYFHPQWIKAMQDEGYAGTLALLDVTNNLWGWQVVDPDNVRDDQWQEFFEIYVQDKYNMDMREWFEKSNPHALAQMIERMLEASRKEYWQTDKDTIKKLVETYIELANAYDVVTPNKKFTEFLEGKAVGFGLAPLMNGSTIADMASAAAQNPMQQVQGQKLEKQEAAKEQEQDYQYLYLILLLLGSFCGGAFYQARRG